MKVTLADPAIQVEGWNPALTSIGDFILKVRKTPAEVAEEKKARRAKFGDGAFKVDPIRREQKSCIEVSEDGTTAMFLPGLWPRVKAELDARGIEYTVEDRRNKDIRPPLDYTAFEGVDFRAKQDVAIAMIATADCGIIETPTAFGKCHGKDTKVIMYDGTLKAVQDIVVGDVLMGDDSTPRTVLTTCRGRGPMYLYTPYKGKQYHFTDRHMLSLIFPYSTRSHTVHGKCYECGDVMDISIEDYMKLPQGTRDVMKTFRPESIIFPGKEPLQYSPYTVGTWIGGLAHEDFDRHERVKALEFLKDGIPKGYLAGSSDDKLQLIAGLIDKAGTVHINQSCSVPAPDTLCERLLMLIRSCGLYAYADSQSIGNGVSRIRIEGTTYRIPTRTQDHQIIAPHNAKSVLHTGFTLTRVKDMDYYGFTVSGNHRYLLEDFTVTHNSFIISLLCKAYPTLNIVVTTSSAQVVATLYEYLCKTIPGEVGVLYGGRNTTARKRVICTTLKSLPNIPPEKVQLVFVDECHAVGYNLAAKELIKFCWARRFGFSASPVRNDGSQKMLEAVLGPTILKMEYQEAVDAGSVTPMKFSMLHCTGCPPALYGQDLPDFVQKRLAYWDNRVRNGVIREFVYRLKNVYEGQILIMVNTLQHAIRLHEMLPWFTVAYYGATDVEELRSRFPKTDLSKYKLDKKALDRIRGAFANGTLRYVISTKIFRQGVNFTHLQVLIRADADVSAVEGIQIPGRLSRLDEGKDCAYLIDVDDAFCQWAEHRADQRKALYRSNGWENISNQELIDDLEKQCKKGNTGSDGCVYTEGTSV